MDSFTIRILNPSNSMGLENKRDTILKVAHEMHKIRTSFIMNKIYDIFTAIFVKMNHVNPIETGKITDKLFVVRTGTANFYIYKSGEDMICFDSGFGKSQIIRELNNLDIDPKSITHLFLTHSDFDHANGLSVFENAEIYLSSDEEQMITRKKARKFGLYLKLVQDQPQPVCIHSCITKFIHQAVICNSSNHCSDYGNQLKHFR